MAFHILCEAHNGLVIEMCYANKFDLHKWSQHLYDEKFQEEIMKCYFEKKFVRRCAGELSCCNMTSSLETTEH